MDDGARQAAADRVHALAGDGLRTVAIASRPWSGPTRDIETADETELVFEGLCAFADPPKPTAAAAIARLASAGVGLKILSGDDPVVVNRLAGLVGLNPERILSGSDIAELSDEALAVQVRSADAFGWEGVLVPEHRSVGITPAVRKVSAGATERVPVVRTGSPAAAIRLLQERHAFGVVGLDPAAPVDYHDAAYPERTCLVVGAEGRVSPDS